MKLSDVKLPDSQYEVGLSLLTGKKIKEVRGYFADSFKAGAVFKLTDIELEDGTRINVEGEHDYPFLSTYGNGVAINLDDETIQSLYDEQEASD